MQVYAAYEVVVKVVAVHVFHEPPLAVLMVPAWEAGVLTMRAFLRTDRRNRTQAQGGRRDPADQPPAVPAAGQAGGGLAGW
jgi:hypothetical protein